MEIRRITENRHNLIPLLFLADEQMDMLERYLHRGEAFGLYDGGLIAAAIVTDEGDQVYEVQNIAVWPEHQHKGYGKALLMYIIEHYREKAVKLVVGTGDSPITLPFYLGCGFQETHRIKDFMLSAYDHPIMENGVQLCDKVYLQIDYNVDR